METNITYQVGYRQLLGSTIARSARDLKATPA
jgi:hypothetical protein